MSSSCQPQTSKSLLEFRESYRQVDWQDLLQKAENSLNIVVYYWDKWVQEHEKALQAFLKKPNASIHFFFSSKLEEVQKLFPNNTTTQLSKKIENTYKPLMAYNRNKVIVRFLPRLLNYSMQCVDDKILLMSFFEMYRQEQVGSPAIIIDLEASPHLESFYRKELKGFLQEGP